MIRLMATVFTAAIGLASPISSAAIAKLLSLNFDEALLQKWRDSVTKQQCRFIAATIFADTIDHSVSYTYKKLADCNCTPEELKSRSYDMDEIFQRGVSPTGPSEVSWIIFYSIMHKWTSK